MRMSNYNSIKALERSREERCLFPRIFRSCSNKSSYVEETALHLLEELNSLSDTDRFQILAFPKAFNNWLKEVTHGAKPSTRALYKKKMAEMDDRIPYINCKRCEGLGTQLTLTDEKHKTPKQNVSVGLKVMKLPEFIIKHLNDKRFSEEEIQLMNDCV